MTEQESNHRPKPSPWVVWQYATPTPFGFAWYGILIAAFCYPIVLGIVTACLLFADSTADPLLSIMMFAMLIGSPFAALVYGVLMSIPAFCLTWLLSWGSKGIVSERGASGIFGGLTGFLCVFYGGFFEVEKMQSLQSLESWFFFAGPPLLGVIMGHAGAVAVGYLKRNDGFPFFEPMFCFKKQFTIGYMLILTLIVAVLVIAFKAVGADGVNVGIAWSAYLLVQTLLLVCDYLITRWLRPRCGIKHDLPRSN